MSERNRYGEETWMDEEEVQTDYGQFRRKFVANHRFSNRKVAGRADIPDTCFSIPATTPVEHGYLSVDSEGVLIFTPHTNQDESVVEYRKRVKEER